MKSFIFSFFLLSMWGSSQIIVPKDFMKIPDSLFYKEQLYKNIIPNKQYNYWCKSPRTLDRVIPSFCFVKL
ncbi:hypothetical protein BXY58_0130 [Epilithonimonas arachidiradicis]|uniref:Uncharacterized protein n=1 Tax=Epilithonimonas arachidiradicis TaxID=1617282 RepID=A0A420DCI3_9FLAO|nr:hypothetical protein BXY58_0130 [Epilithonimonas arachidiradicis]